MPDNRTPKPLPGQRIIKRSDLFTDEQVREMQEATIREIEEARAANPDQVCDLRNGFFERMQPYV